jgi:hypothetical protein
LNREKRRRHGPEHVAVEDPEHIFRQLRKRIAEELQKPNLKVKASSNIELAIGTFAPSELITDFCMSDYPFIGSRYVSVTDGHVYIVAGSTNAGAAIMCYRLGFLQSNFNSRGGLAVAVTEDAWMESKMIIFSLYHADFKYQQGELECADDGGAQRRSYPFKKAKAFWFYLKNRYSAFRICDAGFRVAIRATNRVQHRINELRTAIPKRGRK